MGFAAGIKRNIKFEKMLRKKTGRRRKLFWKWRGGGEGEILKKIHQSFYNINGNDFFPVLKKIKKKKVQNKFLHDSPAIYSVKIEINFPSLTN